MRFIKEFADRVGENLQEIYEDVVNNQFDDIEVSDGYFIDLWNFHTRHIAITKIDESITIRLNLNDDDTNILYYEVTSLLNNKINTLFDKIYKYGEEKC